MGFLDWFKSKPAPVEPAQAPRRLSPAERAKKSMYAIVAAQSGGGLSNWKGSGALGSLADDHNREYLEALPIVIQRAQDLDVNNPDIHGWHRQRTAQVLGRGMQYRASINGPDVGLSKDAAQELNARINRCRQIHSMTGGFDARGEMRSEGKLQEQSFLSMLVHGMVVVHRVSIMAQGRVCPMALEIIPGSRIETPREKIGDPLVNQGIQYTDDRRTRITGYWARKPAPTRGNTVVFDFQYDFLPIEDVAVMRITEVAGLDRSLPSTTCTVRQVRNKGEFLEAATESARAQAAFFAAIEAEPGADAWQRAEEDRQQAGEASDAEPQAVGFVTIGGVQLLYLNNGEKFIPNSARLPDPDLPGFTRVADTRIARGLNTSVSRFTREVQSSYSGGRQEEQQDDPVVDQLRATFTDAWNIVHRWFVESLFLAGRIDLPGYSLETRPYFTEARVTPPGKEHINPVDTMNARKLGYALRTLTPQQACEQDGKNLKHNLREWAEAIKEVRDTEVEFDLPEGALDFLLENPTKEIESKGAKEDEKPSPRFSVDTFKRNGSGAHAH